MARTIIRHKLKRDMKDRASHESPDIDSFFSKLAKYIPAEITASFLAIDYLLTNASPEIPGNLYWGIFFVLVSITPLYLYVVAIVEKSTPDKLQLVAAPIAFVVWSFALGGQFFTTLPWYNKAVAQVAVVLATLIIPMVDTVITHLRGY